MDVTVNKCQYFAFGSFGCALGNYDTAASVISNQGVDAIAYSQPSKTSQIQHNFSAMNTNLQRFF